MKRKYFTPEQAEKLLPMLQQKLSRLQAAKQAVELLEEIEIELEDEEQNYLYNLQLEKEYHRRQYLFYRELEALERQGCIIKDIEQGLVDFPCIFQGRDVFLCWRLGEEQLRYWHEIDNGYAERKPIVDLEGKDNMIRLNFSDEKLC